MADVIKAVDTLIDALRKQRGIDEPARQYGSKLYPVTLKGDVYNLTVIFRQAYRDVLLAVARNQQQRDVAAAVAVMQLKGNDFPIDYVAKEYFFAGAYDSAIKKNIESLNAAVKLLKDRKALAVLGGKDKISALDTALVWNGAMSAAISISAIDPRETADKLSESIKYYADNPSEGLGVTAEVVGEAAAAVANVAGNIVGKVGGGFLSGVFGEANAVTLALIGVGGFLVVRRFL